MTQAAAEELELLMREQEEENEAAKKAAEGADQDERGKKKDPPDPDAGSADGDDGEPKAADIKNELFKKAGIDPETEEPAKLEPKKEEPVEGQTDEDVKDLPETLKGDNRKFFIQERIKARKQREAEAKARQEEEQRKAGGQGADPNAQAPNNKQQADQQELTESDYLTAVSWAAQAQAVLDGAYRQDLPEDKAREVLKAANIVLSQAADPTLLARIRSQVMTGQIPQGVDMRSALEIIDREMPFVQARAGEVQRMTQEQQKALEGMKEGFRDALKGTYEQFPEFKPPVAGAKGSPEHEFAVKTMKELSAPEIQALYADPKTQLPKLMKRIKAEYLLEKNEQLAAENAALKARLERGKAPLSGGGSGGGTKDRVSTGETSEDIKKRLEEKTGLSL